jgi:hypothetical protein
MAGTAWVAQLVEHFPEEEGVGGSSPPPSTEKTAKAVFCVLRGERHKYVFCRARTSGTMSIDE